MSHTANVPPWLLLVIFFDIIMLTTITKSPQVWIFFFFRRDNRKLLWSNKYMAEVRCYAITIKYVFVRQSKRENRLRMKTGRRRWRKKTIQTAFRNFIQWFLISFGEQWMVNDFSNVPCKHALCVVCWCLVFRAQEPNATHLNLHKWHYDDI